RRALTRSALCSSSGAPLDPPSRTPSAETCRDEWGAARWPGVVAAGRTSDAQWGTYLDFAKNPQKLREEVRAFVQGFREHEAIAGSGQAFPGRPAETNVTIPFV